MAVLLQSVFSLFRPPLTPALSARQAGSRGRSTRRLPRRYEHRGLVANVRGQQRRDKSNDPTFSGKRTFGCRTIEMAVVAIRPRSTRGPGLIANRTIIGAPSL